MSLRRRCVFAFRAPSSTGFRRAASSAEASTISAPPVARLRPLAGKIKCSGCTVHEAGAGGGGGRSPGFLGRQPFSQLIIPRLAPARRSSTAAQSRSFPSTHVNRLRTFSFFFTSHLKGEKLFNMKKLFFFFPPYTATVASVQGCRWKRLYQRVKCK